MIASAFPLLALVAWQQSNLFSTSLTHRVIITWLEIAFIIAHLALPGAAINLRKNTIAALVAFIALGLASSFNAENTYASIARHTEIIVHILFSISVYQRARKSDIPHFIGIGIIIAFLFTLLHFLLLLSIAPKSYDWVWGFPMFSNIRHWGYLLILTLCVTFSLILKEKTNNLVYLTLFAITFCIFWSGNRASFFPAIFLIFCSK